MTTLTFPFQKFLRVFQFIVFLSFFLSGTTLWADQGAPGPGTLASVLQNKTIRIGVSLFTPWTIQQKNGDLVGFEIDVAKQLAKDLKVTPSFQVLDWKDIVPALLAKKIDIIVAGMVITPQRALKVNFSQPYASSGIGLVTHMGLTKHFTGPNDLNNPNVVVAAVTGTVSHDLAHQIFPKATVKSYTSSQEAITAVTSGKIHGYIEHEPITTFTVLDHPNLVDKPLTQPLLTTKAGFAVNKGDPDFINFLNAWITAHTADMWLASAHKYWFESVKWRNDMQGSP